MKFAFGLILVALGAAAFAIGFRESLRLVYEHLYGAPNILSAIQGLPRWMIVAAPTAGGFVAGLIMQYLSPRSQNVSNVMEAVALGRVQLSVRATAARASAAWTAIAGGVSIGREGPLIEFGGSLGHAVARAFRLSHPQVRVLVAAGTAAGFAAAYNTPFAAVLFVLEAMAGIAAPEMMLPTIAATVLSAVVTRAAVGGGPIYGERGFVLGSAWTLPLFAALGFLAALMASLFRRVLAAGESLVERHPIPRPFRSATGGLIVGLIALHVPYVVGNGFEALNLVLNQRLALEMLFLVLVTKMFATSASVSSGVPGGIFTPTLLVGGVLGALCASGLQHLGWMHAAEAGGLVLVGMAAMTAATIHAPLTAAVMVFELSGDYPIVLPLLLATAAATATSRWLGGHSVYFDELRRRGGTAWELTLDERRLTS